MEPVFNHLQEEYPQLLIVSQAITFQGRPAFKSTVCVMGTKKILVAVHLVKIHLITML
jgi:hypothetical protein